MLRCISGVAASGARRRYRPSEALLREVTGVALIAAPSCYKGMAAPLPPVHGAPASEFAGCCKWFSGMLLSAVFGATSRRLRCCKSSGGLLRRRSGIATMVEGDCYHGGYQVLRLCCKGRPGQPRWSWTAVRSQAGCPWRRARNCLCASSRGPGGVLVFFFFSLPGQFQVHVIGLCACVVHVDTCQSLEPGDRGI